MICTNKDVVNKECDGENTKFVIMYIHIIFVFVSAGRTRRQAKVNGSKCAMSFSTCEYI